jgi:hypothetical protein
VRWCRAYSELSLLTVEVCKVDMDSINIAQDSGGVVRGVGVDRDWTWRARGGLHANLILSLWASGQASAAVLS